jgi:polyisoprenoid-binding protein YceI
MGRIRRHWKGLLVAGVVLVVALGVGVPYVYIHFVEGDQPAALSLKDVPSGSAAAGNAATGNAAGSVDGTWRVGSGSRAGYRVKETLAGQHTTAVGRASAVTGSLTVQGSTVRTATFSVPIAKITSDRSQRDDQFHGRIMEAAKYPTASFTLTRPMQLGSAPAVGATFTAKATGDLMLHGTTRPVTFAVHGKRTAGSVDVTGDIPITYADYHIANPSFGGFVSVGDKGTVEFLLVTSKA